MRWSKLKTWILCATAILSVGALGISVHSVKEDTELMEVVAESIAASSANVTFYTTSMNDHYFTNYSVTNPADPNKTTVYSSSPQISDYYGAWQCTRGATDMTDSVSSSGLSLNGGKTDTYEGQGYTAVITDAYYTFSLRLLGGTFTPTRFSVRMKNNGGGKVTCWRNSKIDLGSYGAAFSFTTHSFNIDESGRQAAYQAVFKLEFYTTQTSYEYSVYPPEVTIQSITLAYTTPELQFAAACSAYRNLGFTYDKNGAGEFTAFRNPRLRFKLNLPSDYSAYIDNENVSVRVKFKNGEAYSEMVLEGSTFMSDGSGGYTCTFSLTNIPPEHFQDEVSFIPIIEGMDLVEQTGTYLTPECCVITLGASVKSMVDAYLGDLYSSLTEAQQQAITAFAEYYASYLA